MWKQCIDYDWHWTWILYKNICSSASAIDELIMKCETVNHQLWNVIIWSEVCQLSWDEQRWAVWIILSWNKFNPSWSIFVLSWYKFIPTWYKFMPGSNPKILDFQIKLFAKNSEIVFSSGFQKLIVVGFESHMIINNFLSN